MIKHLLLGTFLLTSPQPFKQGNYLYIYQQYAKSITEVNYTQNNTQDIYGYYSFNTEDAYQSMQGTIENRTTTLYAIDVNSYTHEIVVKALTLIEVYNNYYHFEGQVRTYNQLQNIGKQNLKSYKIFPGGYGIKEEAETKIQESFQYTTGRYTNPVATEAQIDQAWNKISDSTLIDGSDYYNRNKIDNANTFYSDLDVAIKDTNMYKIIDYNYIEEDVQNTLYIYQYLEFVYEFTGTWANATQETKNSYINLLENLNQTVEYEFNYTPKNIVITTEVIDIPGLLFTILGMPFAWISTAFNLTIFPGTPYAVNISHLILSIIGVLIAIFIIKRVIK